jgi:DNA-binding NarL/FixJ family response regulator
VTSTRPAPARILPVDDHGIVTDGIRAILSPHYTILPPVAELGALLHTIADVRPDLVILDLQMGEKSSLPVIADGIARGVVTCPYIVFTMNASRATREAVFAKGALACVSKFDDPRTLLPAVRAALAGERYPPEGQRIGVPTAPLAEAGNRRSERIVVDGVPLRHRQVELLLLLRQHHDRSEVARLLGIERRTVYYHLSELRSLIGLDSLAAILRWVDEHHAALERSLAGDQGR